MAVGPDLTYNGGDDAFVAKIAFDLIPPPSCANATASPNRLWPPNHKFVSIQISGIVNPAPGPLTITVTSIFQDEPVQSSGSGNTSPDATGVGTANPSCVPSAMAATTAGSITSPSRLPVPAVAARAP